MKRLDEILTRAFPQQGQPEPSSSNVTATSTAPDAPRGDDFGVKGAPARGAPTAGGNGAPTTEEDEEVCPKCGGAGFVRHSLPLEHPDFGRAVPCDCIATEPDESRMARLLRYSSLGPLTRHTFKTLLPQGRSANPHDRELFASLVADAKAFAEDPQGWMLIHGPSGSGKTHVGAAITNRCLERGQASLFVVVPDLLDHLRETYSPGSDITYDVLFEQVRNAPVLVLDDLGTQHATPWAQEKLFQLLNHRYNSQLPTVVTTNERLDRIDDRLRTRLTDPELSRTYFVEAAAGAVDADLPDSLHLNRIYDLTFEKFDIAVPHLKPEERWSLEAAYRAALAFAEKPEDWLLIWGPNGCGKTHLAAAIANRRLQLGERPVFFFVADLLDYLRSAMDPENQKTTFREAFDELRNASLLILDDLGVQAETAWVRNRLYQLINHRYMARLPTVFTASADSMHQLVEERILARLNDPGICVEVPITAPAYRADLRARTGGFESSRGRTQPPPATRTQQRRRPSSR